MAIDKLRLTSVDIETTAKKLVKKLRKLKLKKDTLIIGIGRGGLIPAQYVAYGLGLKNIEVISSSLYKGKTPDINEMRISGSLTIDYSSYSTIILVDDLIDTGITIDVVAEIIEKNAHDMGAKLIVIPAVLYSQKTKKQLKTKGAIVGKYLKNKKPLWLDFPWDTFMTKKITGKGKDETS